MLNFIAIFMVGLLLGYGIRQFIFELKADLKKKKRKNKKQNKKEAI